MANIRRAGNKDIKKILKLLIQVDMVHHRGRPDIFKGPATKYNESELLRIIDNEQTPVFVYEDDEGNVLGHCFAVFVQKTDDNVLTDIKTLYIDDICVDENERGKHVGRELFEYAKHYAKENECYNITLNVWAENKDAMHFYESLGLKPQKIGMEMILNKNTE